MRGWRTTSTSPSSSSEEVSSEEEPSEDPSSHEKSDKSEKSSSLIKNKVFALIPKLLMYLATSARRLSLIYLRGDVDRVELQWGNLCLNLVPTSLWQTTLWISQSLHFSQEKGKIPFLGGSRRLRHQIARRDTADVYPSLIKGENPGLRLSF